MLYHISLRSWDIIDEFIPRVPESRSRIIEEDSSISRICLSNSLDGCFSGVPWGGYELLNNPPMKSSDFIAVVRVYEFDEREINKENILSPEDVKEYVLDAELTQEHWIVGEAIKPDNSYVIILTDFYFEEKVVYSGEKGYKQFVIKNIKYERLSKEEETLLIEKFKEEKKI